MNNFYKTSPRIRKIVPPFLLHILAPNKIKRPILRKKGDCSQWPSKKYYALFDQSIVSTKTKCLKLNTKSQFLFVV